MSALAQEARFVRRTSLKTGEYRTNFRQIDCDVISALTSAEASRVTPLMSKIYLRLISAPTSFWERDGVLRFAGDESEGKWLTAWAQLIRLLEVANATAHKAISWMHEQGIVGYHAGKNGVGIRIFINRASSSIASGSSRGQKNLQLIPIPSDANPISSGVTPFKESFACLEEVLEKDLNPHAPKDGAEKHRVGETASQTESVSSRVTQTVAKQEVVAAETVRANKPSVFVVDEMVQRLRSELEPYLKTAASQAAAREHEQTRQWLEQRGLPKAARVAQREAYNVLRQHGVITSAQGQARSELEVGRASSYKPPEARPRTREEIAEVAEMCVSLYEAQGKSIDLTLAEIKSEGGWLLPEDAMKAYEAAQLLMLTRKGNQVDARPSNISYASC
ncbi:MAG: hypothetical protein H0T92_19125 [Pyrinomonadaceae bacterium]|nr:hypothetical protein [Pyrinomonadaceae bacterium]